MHRLLLPLCLLGLLLSGFPAQAFFEEIEALEQNLTGGSSLMEEDIDALLEEVETLSPAIRQPASFTDVPADAWYWQYVQAVASWGIVSGYRDAAGNPTGYFGPGDPVTIAQMLKISLRSASVDETKCLGNPSHPQARGHWARPFVLCAEQRGMRIMRNSPSLDRSATRAEVLVIFHDAFGDRVPVLPLQFIDTKDHAYQNDISFAAMADVVSGDTDASGARTGYFRPDDSVKRGEVAKIAFQKVNLAERAE